MIGPSGAVRVMPATRPVDFRKGMDGLAMLGREQRGADPLHDLALAGLTLYVDDGRVEVDSNTVERSIRPLALTRKNALFAGSDRGGRT